MCFNLGYITKKRRIDDEEKESKGLLLKEIEKWKKHPEMTNQPDPGPGSRSDATSLLFRPTNSNSNSNSNKL
ncbi:hypothetical protein O6P43_023235 [Quillaja saponaria]|uniref:Uncharacterized protein n=1 Tax=Quillaja saponaria TaxID=32244 RepID=A0AAD7LEV2_QUISA|nr:hypothetical protein O6P43_023235 [Quillaja saponaria]